MSSELKPCPFCQHRKPVKKRVCRGGVLLLRCYTRDCPASFAYVRVEVWNRRAPSPAVKALVGACRDVLKEGRPLRADIVWALEAVEREIGGA